MSRAYEFDKPDGLYFITFATVGWVDVFTRRDYKDIVVESLHFCQKEKGLLLFTTHPRGDPTEASPTPPAPPRWRSVENNANNDQDQQYQQRGDPAG